jgi:hypothetical protein
MLQGLRGGLDHSRGGTEERREGGGWPALSHLPMWDR